MMNLKERKTDSYEVITMPSKEPTRDKVLSLLAQRLTQKAIAKKLGISRSAVSKHLLKDGKEDNTQRTLWQYHN